VAIALPGAERRRVARAIGVRFAAAWERVGASEGPVAAAAFVDHRRAASHAVLGAVGVAMAHGRDAEGDGPPQGPLWDADGIVQTIGVARAPVVGAHVELTLNRCS